MSEEEDPRPPDDSVDETPVPSTGLFGPPPNSNTGKLGYITHRYENLTRTLRYLAQRDDGWLRMVPSLDEHVVWLKWKFTRGIWEHHYVMVKVEAMRVGWGLELLVDKLRSVDAGEKKATYDRLFWEG